MLRIIRFVLVLTGGVCGMLSAAASSADGARDDGKARLEAVKAELLEWLVDKCSAGWGTDRIANGERILSYFRTYVAAEKITLNQLREACISWSLMFGSLTYRFRSGVVSHALVQCATMIYQEISGPSLSQQCISLLREVIFEGRIPSLSDIELVERWRKEYPPLLKSKGFVWVDRFDESGRPVPYIPEGESSAHIEVCLDREMGSGRITHATVSNPSYLAVEQLRDFFANRLVNSVVESDVFQLSRLPVVDKDRPVLNAITQKLLSHLSERQSAFASQQEEARRRLEERARFEEEVRCKEAEARLKEEEERQKEEALLRERLSGAEAPAQQEEVRRQQEVARLEEEEERQKEEALLRERLREAEAPAQHAEVPAPPEPAKETVEKGEGSVNSQHRVVDSPQKEDSRSYSIPIALAAAGVVGAGFVGVKVRQLCGINHAIRHATLNGDSGAVVELKKKKASIMKFLAVALPMVITAFVGAGYRYRES